MINDYRIRQQVETQLGIKATSDRPLIYTIDGQYYCSLLKSEKNRCTYHFKLAIPQYPIVDVRNVRRYVVAIPKNKRQRKTMSGTPYWERHNDLIGILEESDINDFYLILWKQTKNYPFRCTIYAYYNCKFLFEIKNITDLSYDVYNFDINNLDFRRPIKNEHEGRELWKRENGKEFLVSSSENISFYNWCKRNKRMELIEFYSKNNPIPVDSDKLLWDDDSLTYWKCQYGHEIGLSVKAMTSNPVTPYYEEEDEEKQETVGFLKPELIRLTKELKEGREWDTINGIKQNTVILEYYYPNGKKGDIINYLAQSSGNVLKINFDVFSVEISTNCLESIRLIFWFNASLFDQCNEIYAHNTVDNSLEFMEKYNNYYKLDKILSECREANMAHDDPDYLEANELSHKYSDRIFITRDKIYNSIVAQGLTTSKWVSEQKLYALVKNYFSDAVFQYKSDWLGYQSLDIFIPKINVGIEYQGEQHYQDIDFFGGADGLDRRKKLDAKKKELCKLNYVTLVEWRYDEPISKETLCFKFNDAKICYDEILKK